MPPKRLRNHNQSDLEKENAASGRKKRSQTIRDQLSNNWTEDSEPMSIDASNETNPAGTDAGGDGLDLLDMEAILKPKQNRARASTVKKFVRRDYGQDKG